VGLGLHGFLGRTCASTAGSGTGNGIAGTASLGALLHGLVVARNNGFLALLRVPDWGRVSARAKSNSRSGDRARPGSRLRLRSGSRRGLRAGSTERLRKGAGPRARA
jgi:hypothetical protein